MASVKTKKKIEETPAQLLSRIAELETKVEKLERQVTLAGQWMRREVEDAMKRISQRRIAGSTQEAHEEFAQENQPDMIARRIREYFGDLLLLNAPGRTIEHLVDAEISWYHLQKNSGMDGFLVIASYQKILDSLMEQILIRDFRKFASKRFMRFPVVNDPLEKALLRIIQDNYSMSLGRIFALISLRPETPLAACFLEYLSRKPDLEQALTNPKFLSRFSALVDSGVFGNKRHEGKISFDLTKKSRQLITGDFQSQDGLLYQLLASQAVNV